MRVHRFRNLSVKGSGPSNFPEVFKAVVYIIEEPPRKPKITANFVERDDSAAQTSFFGDRVSFSFCFFSSFASRLVSSRARSLARLPTVRSLPFVLCAARSLEVDA